MASETTSLMSKSQPPKGTYAPSTPSDLRGPCPMVNCLANHGYISRDGRNIHVDELNSALRGVGVSRGIAGAFSKTAFLERKASVSQQLAQWPWWKKVWYYIRNPRALLLSKFGLRPLGQIDARGKEFINLDQIALHNAVEHDVSLSRRDWAQGDNISPQPDLIKELLASSSDGGKYLTMQDLAAFRRRRIEQQREDNPKLQYGHKEHQLSCGEIALILGVLGDGKKVRCDFVRAFFQEERLPVREGWKRRWWWPLGFLELGLSGERAKKAIGLKF